MQQTDGISGLTKMAVGSVLMVISTQAFAVEGYKDIYLDREAPINIHSIYCGKDLKNLRALKGGYVYTNTQHIEKGTYYFTSQYGEFSYTFNPISGQDSSKILARGLLSAGKMNKNDMQKEVCIVGKIAGLPKVLLDGIHTKTMRVEDPEWDVTMTKYGFFGKPAFGKGVYKDSRTLAKYDDHDQKIYDANQAYIQKVEALFAENFEALASGLPKRFEDAVKYAYQEDGFLAHKKYPTVKEPTVWTAAAKKRYDVQMHHLTQGVAYDKIIQANFDWFFNLTGKGNALTSSWVLKRSELTWNGQIIEQTATIRASFADGKSLDLDFIIKSEKLSTSVFATLAEVKKASFAKRNSIIMGANKPIKPITPPAQLQVYSSAEKKVLFFSPFRSGRDHYTFQ